ncbi:hypothetical protein D3C76_594390 [compost metagenome]|uniref:Uncharacterized protein n=1 Tax=Pseudomonas jinjuensis TaxID=198616 RepID=A0A1G9ZF35_9PSED|nr:type III secretion system co-regulatory protein PtrC [Pseudomonas jinjuensis]SDN19053.1 hypothetical protein SAMN05216193_101455 [Pseudomonas jinjuensis]
MLSHKAATLAYRITYITVEDQDLQFETQIAIHNDGRLLSLCAAPTLPSERKELRELIDGLKKA